MKKELKKALTIAADQLRRGNPDEAITALKTAFALLGQTELDRRKLIEKAIEEADCGTLERAEHFLEMALTPAPKESRESLTAVVGQPGSYAVLQKPIFRFQPNKRAQADGGRRLANNGQCAKNGDAILDIYPEREDNGEDSTLADALTDLLHFCDRDKIDFDSALEMARLHHRMER
ncbi:MAG TPA: hypothetical protein VH598_11130 [Verrucomicrobiae bacterium]|jgi:hypothetical protein|nr:hypothetical protein [Verrucomicrobiae bacterium]